MSAVWMRARAELRGRWRALLGLSLVIGLGGGATLGAAMGARRTETAYPRFLEASNAHDVLLSGESFEALDSGFYEAAASLSEVEAATLGLGVALSYPGREVPNSVDMGPVFAGLTGRFGRALDRPKVLEGRLPDPAATDQVFANRAWAEAMGVTAGERLVVRQLSERGPVGPRFTIVVVGIGVTAAETVPVAHLDAQPSMWIPTGVTRAHLDIEHRAFEGLFLKLQAGTDVGRFERTVRRLADGYPAFGGLFFASQQGRPAVVQRVLRPQVVALASFAALAGVTMLLVIGQALVRMVRLEGVENHALGALGMSRRQLFAVAMARGAVVASVGAIVAVAVAIATSPLTPIGPARLAEIDPGLHANVAMLAIGAAGIMLAFIAATALPAWRAARPGPGPDGAAPSRPSAIATLAARLGTRPSTGIGVRMALEPGHGRTAVPVRTTLVGTAIALAAVVAAFTFGASLDRLVSTPRLYGQDWDILSDTQFGAVFGSLVEVAKTDPSVEAVSGGTYGLLPVGGEVVPAVGLDALRGTAFPTLIEGRPPSGPDEIVLGSTTMRRLDARVGDRVAVGGEGDERSMVVVGTAVFPKLGQGSFTPTALGEGAAVQAGELPAPGLGPGRYNFLLIRTAGGPSAALSSELERLCDAVAGNGNPCSPSQRPADIDNYAQMRGTPYVLTGILAALALASLAHAMITTVGRRRRDLAVLKTLGFARRQVRGAVAWQVTSLTGGALLLGIPLGIAAGRWGWTAFAGQLGVLPETATPVATILGASALALVLANAVAALPARAAARTKPALVLRSE